jgi:DNA-binding winged helix-turn-helix (wHTH) protein
MIYHFDQFELDMARFELREEGAVQTLEPQVFTLLAYLIEHRERLVPKNELFEKLWVGRVVSDSALTSRIKSARRVLGDSGKAQHFIKTIYGKGFRFVAEVWFADGLKHELITELTRLRWLLTIARGGMDSVRPPLEESVCACRRCAARLNGAVATLLETGHVDLKLVNPVNRCPDNKRLGNFDSEPSA